MPKSSCSAKMSKPLHSCVASWRIGSSPGRSKPYRYLDGRQSGEQWVRRQYPAELKAIRQRDGAFLVVVTDADNLTTVQRRRQLDQECQARGVPRRSNEDRALVVTPKRNIETWLAWLSGDETALSEQDEHPKLDHERDCKPMVERLYAMCHVAQRLDNPCPPSLSEACEEYRRLRR